MSIAYRDENSASAALADLLRSSRVALRAFWRLVDPAAQTTLPENVTIDHLHRTDQAREIDILIHAGRLGVIVECKVGDEKKPYQFEAYAAYWNRTRNAQARLVWLIERNRRILGDDQFEVTTLTWLQLRKSLLAAAAEASVRESAAISNFCTALLRAGIGRPDASHEMPRKRAIGYDHDHAASILNAILESSGLTGSALAQNALNPALHAGRLEWATPLDDDWVRRVWLYFTPLSSIPNTKGPFHFHGQVLLFHAGFGNKASTALQHVTRWAEELRSRGFKMIRNAPGTWNRDQPLSSGEGVSRSIKHIFAEETLAQARSHRFDWRSDEAAIASGTEHLVRLVRTFDEVLVAR